MGSSATGFIGLGMMGVPMASNLLKAGHAVLGFDMRPEPSSGLRNDANFSWGASAGDVAASVSTLILMLPDSKIVDQLLWADGLAACMRRGALLIDMGSSNPVHSAENSRKLAELGIGFVDAPVSGGVRRAVDGSLTIMAGGEQHAFEAARPTLGAMGKNIVHVGKAGAGHAVKALNNYVSAAGLLAVCEALTAADKFGIDPKIANQVFNTSTGKNNTTDVKVESFMLSGTFNSGFALALMRKDLETAQGFIEAVGTPGEFAEACVDVWRAAEKNLASGADHTAMYDYVQKQNDRQAGA